MNRPSAMNPDLRWVSPASVASLEEACKFDPDEAKALQVIAQQHPDSRPGEVVSRDWNTRQRATVSLYDANRLLGVVFCERTSPTVISLGGVFDLKAPFLLDALRLGVEAIFAATGAAKLTAIGIPGDERIRLAQSLGAEIEGYFRQQGTHQGRPCDLVSVAIFREAFERDSKRSN